MQSLAHTKNAKPSSICVTVSMQNAPHANGFVNLLTQIARKQLNKRKVNLV